MIHVERDGKPANFINNLIFISNVVSFDGSFEVPVVVTAMVGAMYVVINSIHKKIPANFLFMVPSFSPEK